MDPQTLPRSYQPALNSTRLGPSTTPSAHPLPPSHPSAPSSSSAHDNASSHSDGAAASKRRRTSTAPSSSRGVANLTPEQLEKKRANDREAQRAIRERTRTHIEALEKRIRDLSNQQPHQELQTVLKQKQLVEAENLHIKKKLSAALSLLQPLIGIQGGGALGSPQSFQDVSIAPSTMSPQAVTSVPHSHPIPRSVSQVSDTNSIPGRSSASPTLSIPSPVRQNHPSISQMPTYTSQGPVYPQTSAPPDQPRNNLTHGRSIKASGERLNLGFLLDGQDAHRSGGSPHSGHRVPSYPRVNTNTPTAGPAAMQTPKPHENLEQPHAAHSVPIRNIPPTCPLDVILLEFLAERRARAAEGASPTNLVGPPYPSVSSLLNPERSIYAHPLSKVFTDILSKFPDLSALPEQVAVLYIMFLVMRWQISPTQENYERLPDWVTPRPSQLFTPHPAWVDHLPWPRMRDRMVGLYGKITLEDFFIPYTTTLSLNWGEGDGEVLVRVDGGGGIGGGREGEWEIHPGFERHMRELGNWTLGEAFERAFPELKGSFGVKRE
ncbi:MAG: hypothetical protein Q9219_003360 [cf. Caloplaca sp. 3 TL-2023]